MDTYSNNLSHQINAPQKWPSDLRITALSRLLPLGPTVTVRLAHAVGISYVHCGRARRLLGLLGHVWFISVDRLHRLPVVEHPIIIISSSVILIPFLNLTDPMLGHLISPTRKQQSANRLPDIMLLFKIHIGQLVIRISNAVNIPHLVLMTFIFSFFK